MFSMGFSEKPFCFWDVKSNPDLYIVLINTCIIIIITTITGYQLYRFFGQCPFPIKAIYFMILGWGIGKFQLNSAFFIEYSYGIVIFI